MFRDKSLMPNEAVRLAALGLLSDQPKSYAGLADEVRIFALILALGACILRLLFFGGERWPKTTSILIAPLTTPFTAAR